MTKNLTAAPFAIPSDNNAGIVRPEFLRLPKPGFLCPHCGLTRSAINELILPTERNNFKPPVRSFCLRQKGAKTGIRLVDYESLRTHILSNPGNETEGVER